MERYERESIPLAERACLAALSFANVTPDKLTHLITVSCTGFSAPGVDIALIKRLGMPLNVERTHVGFMGCHGALNGLRVARGLLAVEPSARVLLCSVELCSLHYAYGWNPKKVVANALFADGAAAVLLGNEPSPGEDDWRLELHGACLFPDSEQAMAWFIRDHGFDMVLFEQGSEPDPAEPRPMAKLLASPTQHDGRRGRLLGRTPRRSPGADMRSGSPRSSP